jgi:hypothetical protein
MRARLVALCALVSISMVAAADPPESACSVVTPADAPFACIEIIPPGRSAWVTLDGQSQGLSPTSVPELEPGPHILRLDRDGDSPMTIAFTLEPGEVRRFDPPLSRLPALVPPPGPTNPYPIAVMVENAIDARPQIGLDQADVVYEALAEGGISRFLALYLSREADIVGPVRSTRHYFVYTAAEYNPTLVHVGASPLGYAALGATGIRNVNESYGDPGIWRSLNRFAPHNAYTSTNWARAVADDKGAGGPGSWGPLLFKDPDEWSIGQYVDRIGIRYPPIGSYDVDYQYDFDTNRYLRIMDGFRHRDQATGEQLAASSLVIQVVPDEVIDREGRLDLAQLGEGQAYFFQDGVMFEGVWTKASYGSTTLFWDTAGNRVRLNAGGTVWIQLVPPRARLSFR